jgi:DNA-binding NarL/FixJ family response regulator
MGLSSMVVSRDWQEVSVLECILGGLQIDCDVESHPERALAKLAKSKVDALIVDCDLSGTDRFLRDLQRDSHFPLSVPLVVMSGPRQRHEIDATGALFSFEKPISVEQAVRTLSAARNLILDGRLRYHRQALDVPVSLLCGPQKRMHAELLNLSQGGIGVHLDRDLDVRQPIQISFKLPGTRYTVRAKGEIAWTDQQGNAGIRFLDIPVRLQRGLQLWLAQQYFAN